MHVRMLCKLEELSDSLGKAGLGFRASGFYCLGFRVDFPKLPGPFPRGPGCSETWRSWIPSPNKPHIRSLNPESALFWGRHVWFGSAFNIGF